MLNIEEVKAVLSEEEISKLKDIIKAGNPLERVLTQKEIDEKFYSLPSGSTPLTYSDAVIRSVPSDWLEDIVFYLQTYIEHEKL